MEAVQVVCPSGLFPLPARCNIHGPSLPAAGPVHSSGVAQAAAAADNQHQLLEQLQGFCNRTDRLLALISVHQAQGAACHGTELQELMADASACIQQVMQQAAAAKQPLLLTSSQHTSCFCRLLEQLHLLDLLAAGVAAEDQAQQQQQQLPEQQQQQDEQQQWCKVPCHPLQLAGSFFTRLEQQLQSVPGIDAVLAPLVMFCQQNQAAASKLTTQLAGGSTGTGSSTGSGGKPEAIDVSCLSSIQDQHTAARALPLLLRLYFNSNSRAETIAAGKPELLNAKNLERCLAVLAAKPTVPGYADMHVSLTGELETCQALQELLAARKLKLLPAAPWQLDGKSAAKLNQSYSLQPKVLPLLQQHDELCDLLSQLALEVKQAVAVDRDIEAKAFSDAEKLVDGSINFVHAAKNALLELDAWRLSQGSAGKMWKLQQQQHGADDTAASSCDRFTLQDEDVVPFIDVLGATKGLTGLLTDSSSWLEQLLQVQTIKQLHEFAASTLPALAKLYPRNARVQSLIKSSYASMQGQLVELKDDTYAPSYATSVAGDVPVAVLTPTGADGQQRQRSLQRQSGPIAEGFEGLKGRFGSKRSQPKANQQQQDGADADAELDPAAAEEQEVMAAAAAVAAAISSGAATAAAQRSGSGSSSHQAQQAEPAAGSAVEAEASSSAAAAAEAGAAAHEGCEQLGGAAALAAYAAATAGASSSQPGKGKKKKFGKSLMKSIVSAKGKGKPEPSPDPELCSAPAALAAHAALEAMLSEAEVEVAASEEAAAAAAAAAAKAMQDGSDRSSHSSAAGLAEPREQQGSGRIALQLALKGLHLQVGDDESAHSKAGEEGIDTSGFSSMCSLSTAFQRPPDLPWEVSPREGSSAAAAAASGAYDGSAEYSPRSVAAAAAQFESRIAQQTSRRSSRLSSNQAVVGIGATTPPRTSLPPSPRLLAGDELDLADGAEFELAEASSGGASQAVPSSPRSARRFHFFRFKRILQHHEKLSTQALAEAAAAAAALEAAAAKDGDGDAAASGTSARIRAVLSMRRRTSAASAVTAAAAAVDGKDATDAEQGAPHAADLASGEAAAGETGATAGAALPGVSPRGSQAGDTYDAADVPASTHGAADVADQPSKQGRIGGLMSRAASRMMNLSSRASREPASAGAPAAGASSSQQARHGFKGLNFTAKLKKAMVDRRGPAEVAIDGIVLPTLQLESVPPLACLLQLRVLLEQLMHEIKTETKKHLMTQLQMAAAAAAGGSSAKPDASIARPLRQVKAMIKAVHRMQLVLDYPRQLAAAADMSGLWLSRAYSSFFAAEQEQVQQLRSPSAAGLATVISAEQPQQEGVEGTRLYNLLFDDEQSEGSLRSGSQSSAAQQRSNVTQSRAALPFADASCQDAAAGPTAAKSNTAALASFPAALLAGCMWQLQRLPAELPLVVLHLFWDARDLLQGCGLLSKGLPLLRQQEEACMCCYVQHLVPTAYEHFKRIAAHQTVTCELLSSCGARSLQPVQPLYFDALLREPCPVVLQGDYSAVTRAAEGQLAQPGSLSGNILLQGLPGKQAIASASGAEQQQLAAKQLQVIHELQHALQALQQEQEAVEQQLLVEQQQQIGDDQQLSRGPSPGPAYGGNSLPVSQAASPEKLSAAAAAAGAAQQKRRQGHRSKRRAAAAQAAADEAASPAAVAGQTPLMQRLEQLKLAKQLMQAQQQQAGQALVEAESCSMLNVRQWLLAGLLASLKKDAAAVVARARLSLPSAVVEIQLQAAILQRTHQLVSQYAPLPCSWPQLWERADAADAADSSCKSACAQAVAGGVLAMLDTAVYDSEAMVLLPAAAAAANASSAADLPAAGVLGEVSAALRPLGSFFGRQHLQALLGLAGPAGQAHLLEGLMDKLDEEQGFLLDQLHVMQQQLPPALLQLPPAERCHSAGAVLQFYQQQLSSALSDPDGSCSAALACLQRIGNCLALLHLLTMQQSVQATPVFMQVAPLLGIIGRPLTDAAAAAECFEYDGAPDPPTVQTAGGFASRSCAAGLLMPEVEQLLPSESARHAHEMQTQKELQQEQAWRQVAAQQGQPFDESLLKPGGQLSRHRMWQASHFQRLLLGPDAEKVRGPALLLMQTAELRAWRAAQAQECMGPCMERLRRWAGLLQRQLQGLTGEACESEEEVEVQPAAAAAAAVQASSDASAAAAAGQQQQQQYRGSFAGGLPEDLAVRASLAGEVPAGEVAGIGVRENTLYGAAMTPPESPYKEQQGQLAALSQLRDDATDCSAQTGDVAQTQQQQQQIDEQEDAALSGSTSEQQQYHGSEASLSLAGSCIAAKPSSQFSLGGSRPHISYDDSEAMLTPTALQLDPLSADASAVALGASNAVGGGITLKASTAAAAPGFLTSEELQAAAEAAAVAAASLPSSPRAGAAAAAAAAGSAGMVSIWEAAGAAAAQLPAGSVAPAHAKLAYKALLDSNTPQQNDAAAGSEQTSQGSRTYGLAELVGEVSDALSSARSDAGASSGSQRGLSSRQVVLHVAEGQQADADAAAAGEAEKVKQRAAGMAAGSGRSSPCHSPRGLQRSSFPGAPEDAAGSEDDTASESDVEQEGWKSSRQQPRSRLRHRSSGGAPSDAAVAAAAAAAADASSENPAEAAAGAPASSAAASPSRVVVPRLGLEALSPAKPAPASDAGTPAALSSRSGPGSSRAAEGPKGASVAGSSRTASSRAYPTSRSQFSAPSSCPTSSRQRIEEQQQQGGSSDAEEASKTDRESVVDGSYPAPNVNDLLFESTCCELVRVKDENNVLRSELEMLRNQLQNRDTSLALLSGNLFTPRPSERGISEQRPPTVPEEGSMVSPPRTERPGRSRTGTPRGTQPSSEAAVAAQAPAVAGAAGAAAGSSTANQQRNESADGSADVTVSSGGGTEAAKGADVPAGCASAAASAAAALPSTASAKAAKLQPRGLGLSAGLIKGPAGLGLSPEPSDLRIESSKISMRAQQPSPLPPTLSNCGDEDDNDSSSDDSSSTAGDGSNEDMAGGFPTTRKLKLPTALHAARNGSSSSHAAQLAVAMSALKFALLLGVAQGQARSSAAAAATSGESSNISRQASAAVTPQASPRKRLVKAASATVAGGTEAAAAAEQPTRAGSVAAIEIGRAPAAAGRHAAAGCSSGQAEAADNLPAAAARSERTVPLQHPAGSGRIAGGGYGDGPLLASAVLLQLTGQARKHALLDATSRIAHWVEYDAVKVSGAAGTDSTTEAAAGTAAAAGVGADGSGTATPQLPGGLQTPGGISASAASSMALPKPRSKKRQEEEAEEEAQMRKQQAEEQLLLQRLAAAARQADRVAKDGASLAERFAPAAPAHSQRVQVKVHRIDKAALLAQREGSTAGVSAASATAAELGKGSSRFGSLAGAGASAGFSQPGTPPAQEYAVLAVPVKQEVLEFSPHVRPWAGLTPSHWPIQSHPLLPMQRPQPLLLPGAGGKAGVQRGAAAAGAGGVVGSAGRLLPGVGVGANAGLVAAARAVHAREALLAAMPRTAVYSFSVMSDHNRSGRMDDGYSKAPSTADLDNLEDISPRKAGRHTSAAAAAAAARLGGMCAAGTADQSGGYSASEASSPSKSPTRSPTKRQQAAAKAGGLFASLVS